MRFKNRFPTLIITNTIECDKENCSEIANLKIYEDRQLKTLVYRCSNNNCRSRKTMYSTKLPLTKFLHILYMILTNFTYKQLNWYFSKRDSTILKYKKIIKRFIYKVY